MVSETEDLPILTAYPVTLAETAQGISRTLYREKLEKISESTEITFPLKVNFNETSSEIDAINFPTLALSIINSENSERERVEDFSDYSLGNKTSPFISKWIIFTGASLTVQMSSDTEGKDLSLTFNASNLGQIHLPEPYSQIKFKVRSLQKFQAMCQYDNGQMEEHDFPGGSATYEDAYTQENRKILRIQFRTQVDNIIFLDDIRLYK